MTGIHNWICNSHDMGKTQTDVVSLTNYRVLYLVLFLYAGSSCSVCKVHKFQYEEHSFVGEFGKVAFLLELSI